MSDPVWKALGEQPAWEIAEIPRPGPPGADASAERERRMLSLAAASRKDSPVAFGWVRENAGGPVRVITAGAGLDAGGEGEGPLVPLAFPAGALGRPLPPGDLAAAFTAIASWVPIAVTADVLLRRDDDLPDSGPPTIEDGLLRAWRGPFGWLTVATPVARDRHTELLAEASLAQLMAERHDTPRAELAARRARARHDELRQAMTNGLWRIFLLAGSVTPAAARRVAGLLCASLDLRDLPFGLTERSGTGPLPILLTAPSGNRAAREAAAHAEGNGHVPEFPDPEPEYPAHGSSTLLAALAVPPAREVPGIRIALRPEFDVTPESPPDRAGAGIEFGVVLDQNRSPAGELTVPRESLNRHTFVCGATGSGKSQTVRHLLESATKAGIPWLVIEPAKAEYRLMAARLPGTEIVTIRPGDLTAVPAGINPLEPAAGPDGSRFPLQSHADLVRALFLAAFRADEPFPQVLAAALTRCYTGAGRDMVTGEPAVPGADYPALGDLQAAALAVVEEIGYSREITDNVRGFVSVRIGSLRGGTTGRFLDGGFPLDYDRLLSGNVVLEIEDCGDDTDKAFLTGAVLIRLTEHLRLRARAEGPSAPGLRHLTVVEEAHRLLRQPPPGEGSGPAAHAVEMFAGLLAEIRAYGEGLIIAEQIPSKLIPDVIKNTAVKIVHRLPAKDDRDTVGATMNLTEDQSRYLVTLTPGEAAVFTDGMDYPVLAKMPDGTGRETGGKIRSGYMEGLIGVRSPACPADCRDAPCDLGRIAAAQRALARDPVITLWAELAVVAHLAGWPAPAPGSQVAARLAAMEPRQRDCALARAIDDAVAARVPAISARVAGPALAAHVAQAIRGVADDNQWPCGDHEPQWLAPAFAWTPLARRASPPPRAVVLGTRSPSAIETAAGTWAEDPDFADHLAAALADFTPGTWYADRIAAAATGSLPK